MNSARGAVAAPAKAPPTSALMPRSMAPGVSKLRSLQRSVQWDASGISSLLGRAGADRARRQGDMKFLGRTDMHYSSPDRLHRGVWCADEACQLAALRGFVPVRFSMTITGDVHNHNGEPQGKRFGSSVTEMKSELVKTVA